MFSFLGGPELQCKTKRLFVCVCVFLLVSLLKELFQIAQRRFLLYCVFVQVVVYSSQLNVETC